MPTRHTHKWDGLHTRHLLESKAGVACAPKDLRSSFMLSDANRDEALKKAVAHGHAPLDDVAGLGGVRRCGLLV